MSFATMISYIFIICLAVLVPALVGKGLTFLCRGFRDVSDLTFSQAAIAGYLFVWAIVEAVAVPLTIFKLKFNYLVIFISVLCLILVILGLVGTKKFKKTEKTKFFSEGKDFIFFTLLMIAVLFLIYKVNSTLFYDADDSRFMVNAVDIIRSNRILANNPITGMEITADYDDFIKDLVGQWAAFLAYGAKITHVNVTVFAHTIYPVIAVILLCFMYWNVISEIKEDVSVGDKSLTMIVILAMYAFGYFSTYTAETFTLVRVWQGKATLASIGVLAIIFCFMKISKEPKSFENYALLLLANVSACLMTSMGIIIGAVLIGGYGFVMTFYTKKFRVLVLSALICSVNVALFLLSELYTLEMYLN